MTVKMLTNILPTSGAFWDRSLTVPTEIPTNFAQNDLHTVTFSNMLRASADEQTSTSASAKHVVGRLQMPCQPKPRLCEVCGNAGATSHYGGTVCGGCKIFFSRTVQSRKGFVCEREGQCPMNAGKRAKCRACRFQLCLRAHMSPEEVGRLRDMRMGEFAPIIKNEGSVVGYFDENSQPSTSMEYCVSRIPSFTETYRFCTSETAILSIFVNLERSCENNGAIKHAEFFPKKFNAAIDMINAITFPVPICEKIPMDYLRELILKEPKNTLKLYWCRNVLHFLEWTQANDDFNRFSMSEKIHLIAENFLSVSCLTTFYGFLKNQREKFETLTEETVPPPCAVEWFSEIVQLSHEAKIAIQKAIAEIMEPMDSLDMSFEELILLKFILLFNEPAARSSYDSRRIRCYRLKYCELLQKYIKAQIADPDKRIARIGELLKIVEAVKNTATYLDTWLTMFYASNTCDMNDVLVYDFHVRAWSCDVAPQGMYMKSEY
ncbi:unnamed protein product [Caenorhabditis sp. 36 PRJEB53466]|nr:unnamed protein product [Caenorhabditis sp. 36 PRJEB53466]